MTTSLNAARPSRWIHQPRLDASALDDIADPSAVDGAVRDVGAIDRDRPQLGRDGRQLGAAVLILGLFQIFRVMAALILGHGFVSGLALAGGGCPVLRVRTRADHEGKTR